MKKSLKSLDAPRYRKTITLNINGKEYTVEVESRWTLLKVLREKLGLTAAKRACETGECGACTVLIQDIGGENPVLSCLMLAVEAEGKKILTLEGLSKNGELHPIQKAFIERGAMQCGFCTPGVIMVTKALLSKNPNPKEDEIKDALVGNLCRCGAYPKIVEAVLEASKKMAGGSQN